MYDKSRICGNKNLTLKEAKRTVKRKWSKAKIWEWYNAHPWIRGCNFIGSDCVNRLDMWQSYGSEEKLATAERELALCQKIGFNTVRLWANFDVYYKEPDSYMEIFDRYIDIFARHGMKVMVVLCHEEDLPLGDEFRAKEMGEQTYALGWHQGRTPLTDEEKALMIKHNTLWGCDECQTSCPHNRNPKITPVEFFHRDRIPCLTREILDSMSDEDFEKRAFAWRKRKTVERNLEILSKK